MKGILIPLIVVAILYGNNIFAQNKQTYKSNGTTYYSNETYKTTGRPKVERSSTSKTNFLKNNGLSKIPEGYQIDHITPLSEGGLDLPSNMQLISVEQHKQKTAYERKRNSSSTYRPSSYKSTSTYKIPSYNSTSTYKGSTYSKSSYSNSSGKAIYTGSKGGKYYYSGSGKKTYIRNH